MMEWQQARQAEMVIEGFEPGAEALSQQEDVLDWLSSIGKGAAVGAATGAVGGPFGALIGGATGAITGAVQAAQQSGAPAPHAPVRPKPATAPAHAPVAASGPAAAGPAPSTLQPPPMPASSAPLTAAGPAPAAIPTGPTPAAAPPPAELLQQLAQLLPQLTQLLAQSGQPSLVRRAGEAVVESDDSLESGGYILDKIPFSESSADAFVTAAEAVIDYPIEWTRTAAEDARQSFTWTR